MNEWLVLAGIALAAVSGLPGLFCGRDSPAGERVASGLIAAGAASAICGAVRALTVAGPSTPLHLGWSVPAGAFHVEVDPLSAMFVAQVFVLSLLGAIYGLGYWAQADHPEDGRKLRVFYGLLTAAMALLGIARNMVLFMVGWEVMALAAFLTLTTEDRRESVRDVGYLYLIATRVGTLCVIACFCLLTAARGNGEIDGTLPAASPLSAAIFVLALAGFGLKAGVMPLHVWLPGAHASAPSHVSAVMSGSLIKMGIYGFLRVTSLFPSPPIWWGGTTLALGLISGVLGVAFAIAQHDLKRLLAYHSVENIGIICLGIGIALVGRATGRAELVALGLAGGLLHVWNHGLFKALLFLAAGSVLHATGTREIDHLGGLMKRMPWTAPCFLVGAVAICGLPPLNGLVSEFLIYLGFLHAATAPSGSLALVSALAAALLALIGTLATACFVKVFGAVFLGEPRSVAATAAHETAATMIAPMLVLAALCFCVGLAAPLLAPALDRAVETWAPELTLAASGRLAPLGALALLYVPLVILLLLASALLIARVGRVRSEVGTWDCGYAAPTARMQYTASSFAQMLVRMFARALRPNVASPHLDGFFPGTTRFHSHVPDTVLDRLLVPATRSVRDSRRWVLRIQHGSIHAYIFYILVALVFLLMWEGG